MTARQQSLCCPCGSEQARWARGMCRRCYDAWRYSQRRFNGRRGEILSRDGFACAISGSREDLNVHHRSKRHYVTLSRAWHTRVHKTLRLRYGMSPLFVRIWEEQHGRSRQLELPFTDDSEPVQQALFLSKVA